MADLCMAEFNARLAKIEKARAKGYGFEAIGTLGRSAHTPPKRRKARAFQAIGPLLIVLISGTMMKAVFLHHLGLASYEDRIARLMQGSGIDQIGAWVMQADPLTVSLGRGLSILAGL